MKETLYSLATQLNPHLMAVQASEVDGKKRLILMGAMLVAFVVVFIVVSKKMKKK